MLTTEGMHMTDLRRTKFYDLHVAKGAKMVPFAGWEMPVQYPMGVMEEHLHTRAKAGLFDVSHMGQVILRGENVAEALESLTPAAIIGLAEGKQKYALFTADNGGILDDLMVANKGDHLYLVVNASRADHDIQHLRKLEAKGITIEVLDRSLLALQGPDAAKVMDRLVPGIAEMKFMDVAEFEWNGATIWAARAGYTGEDGFEVSLPNDKAVAFAEALLAEEEVAPIGLGARDSLRLEAGMPLYGNDMDENTTPAQASLNWSIPKSRRLGGAREGGFPGADMILAELANGADVKRVGLRPEGRAPIREGTQIFATEEGGEPVGRVRSGGFAPSVGAPVATAEIRSDLPADARLFAEVRGRRMPVVQADLPFITPQYKR